MGTLLIAMPKPEDAHRIEEIIRKGGLQHEITVCKSGSSILRIAGDRDYGVVICTSRLKDMGYSELSEYLPPGFGMIILTKDSTIELFSDRMVRLMIPFKPSQLLSTIETVVIPHIHPVRKRKLRGPRARSDEENRVIETAKGILMERNKMTEPEAFRYIQKVSMDAGRTMVESAQMIILMDGS